nr:MAG TPA: hypothetical protein [Bacteriophage sp.]
MFAMKNPIFKKQRAHMCALCRSWWVVVGSIPAGRLSDL